MPIPRGIFECRMAGLECLVSSIVAAAAVTEGPVAVFAGFQHGPKFVRGRRLPATAEWVRSR